MFSCLVKYYSGCCSEVSFQLELTFQTLLQLKKKKGIENDGIPAELFEILKDDAVKVLHSIWQQIWNTVTTRLEKVIPVPKKGNAKECSNYFKIELISYASKAMLKMLQASLEQYMNQELPDVQAGFRKGRGTRNQIANIPWITKNAKIFQKKYLLLLY